MALDEKPTEVLRSLQFGRALLMCIFLNHFRHYDRLDAGEDGMSVMEVVASQQPMSAVQIALDHASGCEAFTCYPGHCHIVKGFQRQPIAGYAMC